MRYIPRYTMPPSELEKYVQPDPRSGVYRYYRRVPRSVAHLDSRLHVRKSLNTRNLSTALRTAEAVHRATEALWAALLAGENATSAWDRHTSALGIARAFGFGYRPVEEVADQPLPELIDRIGIAHERRDTPAVVEALTGIVERGEPRLGDLWEIYEKQNEDGLAGMSQGQLHAHKASRERAISYAISQMGDLPLKDVTRDRVLEFRSWWLSRVRGEGLKAYTANRGFNDIRGMLRVVDEAFMTEYRLPWTMVRFKETNATKLDKRPPFPVEWVRDRILAPGALDSLYAPARYLLLSIVETGMRPGESCNLRPEDIRLDHEIPHIAVADRDDRRQKSDSSIRRIPLVGVSLWAMQQMPQGFSMYADKAAVASSVINKFLRESGLKPTPKHTLYSLRHTFQDRIENAGASDRMQTDLMGHKFERPLYGDGAEMVRRHEFLSRIAYPWTAPA